MYIPKMTKKLCMLHNWKFNDLDTEYCFNIPFLCALNEATVYLCGGSHVLYIILMCFKAWISCQTASSSLCNEYVLMLGSFIENVYQVIIPVFLPVFNALVPVVVCDIYVFSCLYCHLQYVFRLILLFCLWNTSVVSKVIPSVFSQRT